MNDNTALLRLAYVLPNLLAAFSMLWVAALVWGYRRQQGGMALTVFSIGAAIWALGVGLSFIGLTPEAILFIWCVTHIGVASTPIALLVFVLGYLGYSHFLTRRFIAMLAVIPALDLVLAWTNPWHNLIWVNVWVNTAAPFPMLNKAPGPFLWVYYAYAFALAAIGVVMSLRRASELPLQQRRQIYLVMLAFLFPAITCGIYMVGLAPFPNMDFTPFAFNFSGLLIVRAFLRERMFELVPVSAHDIYNSIEDAVFVLDEKNRVQDLNLAARNLLAQRVGDVVGEQLPELFPELVVLVNGDQTELRAEVACSGHVYDAKVTDVHGADRRFSGRLVVMRDISERKRMEEELRRLAITDSLTGLYNRHYFCSFGEDMIMQAQRYKRPLSMIMLDVDLFKNVNDEYGHEAGDRVLMALAALMRKASRSPDCIARIGGEEFVLLLPETDDEGAFELASRLLESIAAMSVHLADNREIKITISAGVATLHESEAGMTQLMRRTDDLLYQAKSSGRGRIVQSERQVFVLQSVS